MSDDLVKRLDALVEDLGEGRACWGSEYIDAAVDATYRIEELVATCEELEADRRKTYEALLKVTRIHDEVEAKLAECEARLEKAVEALDGVMIGGNHLATILPDSFPPAGTEPLIALEAMGYGYDFEVWCCWRAIMLARATLAELQGQNDE